MATFGRVATALWVALAATGPALAAYPDRPVSFVVPQAPGGTNDIVARLVAAEMSKQLTQPIIVNNRPGAGGNIGAQEVRNAAADGYTLLVTVSSTLTINPSLYKDLGFDPVKDFAPVSNFGVVPNVLLVHPSFPAKTLDEFITLVKANPNKYQYASAGNGTLNHLLGVMLDRRAGLKLQHIPYRGVVAAMTDVLGNQVPMLFGSLPGALPNIREGKLRALGVSTAKRSPAQPDVPAIGEAIPDYSGDLWIAMFAKAGTPQAVLDTLVAAANRVLADPGTQKKFAELGVEPLPDTPEQLARRQQTDMAKWRDVVESSGAKVD
jgi:tripartite-type tricarboxylate transporter receptor subunit TctC